MLEKTDNNTALVDQIYTELEHLFDENSVIDSKIRLYRGKNKNIFYIQNKLREKKFNTDIIDQKMQILKDSEASLLSTDFIARKIQEYIWKHKSRQYIYSKLVERTQDKYEVEKILSEAYTIEIEQEIVAYKIWILHNKYNTQKIIEKLMRDGFSYNLIKKCI